MKESRVELNEELARELDDEERREKNKKVLKILAFIFIPLFVFFTVTYVSLRYIGNIGIIVKEYPIYSSKLPKSFDGIKIVQFSDIHYNEYSSLEIIDNTVELINKTNPDIVIFTGDLIDKNYEITMEEKEYIISKFSEIDVTIGKYSIKGEEDNENFDYIFSNSKFEMIDNSAKNIYKDNSYIQLFALDNNKENYQLLKEKLEDTFVLAITHMPDNSDNIIDSFNPNLILAGHSHNGQIRLPFIGGILKKENAEKYIDSYYKINETELLVSSGLGNSKYNFRLFNHPSINFIRLKIAE